MLKRAVTAFSRNFRVGSRATMAPLALHRNFAKSAFLAVPVRRQALAARPASSAVRNRRAFATSTEGENKAADTSGSKAESEKSQDGAKAPTAEAKKGGEAAAERKDEKKTAEDTKETALQECQAKLKAETEEKFRLVAEIRTMAARNAKEVENTKNFGIQSFARDMLEVSDTLNEAAKGVKREIEATTEPSPLMKTLLEGVEMTHSTLKQRLEKHKISLMDDLVGKPADPKFHNVAAVQPDDTKAAGTILAVLKEGYMLGERLLRPASVMIAKVPEKPAPSA